MIKAALLFVLAFCAITKSAHSWSPSKGTETRNAVRVSRRDAILSTVLLAASASPAQADDAQDGYITTSRGIKYKVTSPPTDPDSNTPERAQKVKAKYTLYLNGFPEDTDKATKIDSSKGLLGEKPFEFMAGVSQVIKGWDLTIMDMRVGESRKLVIPSDLGYKDKGAGGKIPGGATLYFDVELAEIGAVAKLGEEQKKWLEENSL